MADSSITKKALASSLKELMAQMPISKIGVGDICANCEMNRKSFYYHFKDKNDLINWIFDTEFLSCVDTTDEGNRWQNIEELFKYLYENRSFYNKVLSVKDQNCFSDHFKELVEPAVRKRIVDTMDENAAQFYMTFVTDAAVLAIEKWLKNANTMPYTEFFEQLKNCIYIAARHITEDEKEMNANAHKNDTV